jgi:uroporphyrinogen decarboxylase
MNHRERAWRALCHQEPDRVPIDLGSTSVTSITRTAYKGLRSYLGMSPDEQVKISHRPMDMVNPNEDIFQGYDVDFRPVYLHGPWFFKSRELPDDRFYDEYNLKWKKASNVTSDRIHKLYQTALNNAMVITASEN